MDLELEVGDSELLACQFVIHLLGLPTNQGIQGIVFSMGKNQGKRKVSKKSGHAEKFSVSHCFISERQFSQDPVTHLILPFCLSSVLCSHYETQLCSVGKPRI